MKIKHLWDIIVLLFFIIELLLVIMFFVPSIFGIKPFIVTSGSMEPKLPVGSLIYVKNINKDNLKKNDIITFYIDDSDIIATHKIYEVNREEKKIITYGINNKDENGNFMLDANPVGFSEIIGKEILCIPYLGYVNKFVTTSPGLYIIVSITILVIIISFIFDNKKKEEVNKNEK